MKKPELIKGKTYVLTATVKHAGSYNVPKEHGIKYPLKVVCVENEGGALLFRAAGVDWHPNWFHYHAYEPTKVRIKPYRGGFRFEITFANGKKPNHIYNTRAAAKKGLKDLAEALTNYEIVK